MWVPTREEAVAIYARFCRSHYGVNAREKVTSRATQLGRQGDSDGERIWREVAQEIEKNEAGEPAAELVATGLTGARAPALGARRLTRSHTCASDGRTTAHALSQEPYRLTRVRARRAKASSLRSTETPARRALLLAPRIYG
ncbi:MAG: hypothetical protein WA645_10025 [Pseudolabrys sp.]